MLCIETWLRLSENEGSRDEAEQNIHNITSARCKAFRNPDLQNSSVFSKRQQGVCQNTHEDKSDENDENAGCVHLPSDSSLAARHSASFL